MRILRVAQKLYPDTKGGGQYHVHAMSRDQAAMGHDVTVVTTKEKEDSPHRENTHGYDVIRVPKGATVVGNDVSPMMARYLWQHVNEYDIVHAHSHLYFSTNLAATVRRFGDVPLAITNHGLYSQSVPKWVFKLYLRTLGCWTFNQADVVFCYTGTDKRRVRELDVTSRIKVISNGIDTQRFTPEGAKSDLIEDTKGPAVLFVGRLVEGKRPEVAIEAFAEVLSTYPDAEMYLCGEGPLRAQLEATVREFGIESNVTFLGQVPYEEMPLIYRSADVFVLLSRTEGFPRSVLESLLSGTPAVTTNLEQLSQVVSDFGCTISVENPEEIAHRIQELISDEIEITWRRESLSDEFSWRKTVEETTEELKTISERRA